jgi:hypothetical protein
VFTSTAPDLLLHSQIDHAISPVGLDPTIELTDAPSYSAIRAMLVQLEAKGFVKHREEGLRYVYVPTTSRATARRRALQKLVHVFFSGSPSQTATPCSSRKTGRTARLRHSVPRSTESRTNRRP